MGKLRSIAAVVLALLWAALPVVGGDSDEPPGARPPRAQTVQEVIAQMRKDDFNGLAASRRLARIGEPAVGELIQALEHHVPRVRYWSIAALSSIGGERAVPAIKKRLDDPAPLVRAVAVWHLGRWFDRADVREAVLKKLQDNSPFVRGWALRLIQTKKYRAAAAQVRALLKADQPEVRYDALHTLAILEGPDGLELMKQALRKDQSPLVRECALRCCTLIQPHTPLVGEVLIAGLRDKDENVRTVALKLLRRGFGRHFAFDPGAEPMEREEAARRWQNWYEANRERLQWSRKNRRFDIKEEPPAEKAQTEPPRPEMQPSRPADTEETK